MPGITPNYQQHRRAAGNHTRWLDEKASNQQQFASRVQALAKNPGAHSGNQGQHENALALLQLFTLLSAVHNNDPQPLITAAKADVRPFGEPLAVAAHLQEDSGAGSILTGLCSSLSYAFQQAGQFIDDYDPLKFPATEARPQRAMQFVGKEKDDRIIIEDIYGTVMELSRDYYDVANKTEPYQFIKEGQKALKKYYKEYYAQYPQLKQLARKIVKNYIKDKFHLNINPDKFYFMHFNSIEYINNGKLQFAPADITRSLTDCLFTNFEAFIQDNMPDMDAMCGIYRESMINNKEFDANKALGVTPTQFINAVWNINFYQHACNAINKFFANKDMHIKKLFLDFINHIAIANPGNDAVKDVFNGVNMLNDREVTVSFFDIDGYHSPNAFHFENIITGRHTLYFPESDFKFKSFDNDILMRTWVTDACSDKNFRDMLEKHFTLADRQDGSIYSGVDTWINSIAQDHRYYDKIARKPEFIEPAQFFRTSVAQLKEKMLSDADTLIKSDSEVIRDLWENSMDALNKIFFNPFSGFASLALHIEHAAEGDTTAEKMEEWSKLKDDAVNIAALVAFCNFIKLPEIEGYDFIETVKSGINSETLRRITKFSQMEEVYATGSLDSLDKDAILDEFLNQNHPDIAEDAVSLDEILPPDDQISLPGRQSPQAGAPPDSAVVMDEQDPFKEIPRAKTPYTLDEILELDELQSLMKAPERAGSSQQTGVSIAAGAGNTRSVIPSAADASALAIPGTSTQNLPLIRGFVPYQEIPLIKSMPDFDHALTQFISDKLRNHPWDLYLGFNEDKYETIPQYMRTARSVVRMYVKSAEELIAKARRNLSDPAMGSIINYYFKNILAIVDDRVTEEAVHRFRLQIQRISNFFYDAAESDFNNVVIISTQQELVDNQLYGISHHYRSTIKDIDYLRTLSKAFIAKGDPHRRIFVMYDAIPEFDITGLDAFGRRKNNMESTILHEISHLAADTKDFYPNEINPNTFDLGNGKAMLKIFHRYLNTGAITYHDDFKNFMNYVYWFHKIPYSNNEMAMLDLLRKSPMLQANIMMENADSFVAYVKDIGEMKSITPLSKQELRNRKKGYGPKKNQSKGSKPGTSGTAYAHQMLKREIKESEIDAHEKFNGITFTTSHEHYKKSTGDNPNEIKQKLNRLNGKKTI